MKYLLLFLYLTLLLGVTKARPTAGGRPITTAACIDGDKEELRETVPWPVILRARGISRRKVTPVQTRFITKTVTKKITIAPTKTTTQKVPTTVWKTERLTVTATKTFTTQVGCHMVTAAGMPTTVTQTITKVQTSMVVGKPLVESCTTQPPTTITLTETMSAILFGPSVAKVSVPVGTNGAVLESCQVVTVTTTATTELLSTTTVTIAGDAGLVVETAVATVTVSETESVMEATQTVTLVAEPQVTVETVTATSLATMVSSLPYTNTNQAVSPLQSKPETTRVSQSALSAVLQTTVPAIITSHSRPPMLPPQNSNTNSETQSEKDSESVRYTQPMTISTGHATSISTSHRLPAPSPAGPPPCPFPPLALNESFDDPFSVWDILPLQPAISLVFVSSSPFNQIHSGTRSGRVRFSITTIPVSQFIIRRQLTQVCAGAKYTLSAWFRSPLRSTTPGRVCRARFTWTDVLQGTTADEKEIMTIAIPEDGNWGAMQGVFAVGEAAQGGQIQLQVFCEAGPERYIFWDDFVIVRKL